MPTTPMPVKPAILYGESHLALGMALARAATEDATGKLTGLLAKKVLLDEAVVSRCHLGGTAVRSWVSGARRLAEPRHFRSPVS